MAADRRTGTPPPSRAAEAAPGDRRRRTAHGALLAGLAAGAACTSTGGRTAGHGVRIDKFAAEARLETEYRDESYANGAAASTKETIFRENVQFDFDGSVYHQKLLSFGGVLDLGLEQRQQEQSGGQDIRSNDDNNRYDLHAVGLRDHPYSVQVFAQRSQARVRQSFFPTSDAVVTRYGAMVMAKDWIVPSQVEVSTYAFEGKSGDLRQEDRDTLNVTGSRNTDDINVHYSVFAQQVDSDLAGGRYDDFQALAGATWMFGGDRANSLSLDGQQRRQTGDTESENSNLGTRSRIKLADDLDHRAGVAVGRSEFGGASATTTDRTDAFTEFEHHLYDSLTTVLRGDYLEQRIGDGELDRLGGSGRLAYRKKVPFGAVRVDYQAGRSRQDENGRFGANVTVTDEPHTVVFGTPVFLDNLQVDAANLLVTDSSGAIVYSTPVDYLADEIGGRTRLTFPAGSQILPGQTILVTYTFASTLDRSFQTDTQYAGVEFLFGEAFSLDAHWSELDQQLLSGVADTTLDRSTEFGAGARARFFDQNIALEYLDHDSLLTPYTRTRATWYTWMPITARLSMSTNASIYETEFKDEQLRERGLAGLVSCTWNPGDLSMEVRAEVRRSELRTEDGWGAFLQSILRYQFRKTSIDFTLLTSREEWDFSSDRDALRATFTLRRKF